MTNEKCEMINDKLPIFMAFLRTVLLFFLLATWLTSCAPRKVVWYQEDIAEATMRTDLESCSTDPQDDRKLALCMRAKGYLRISEPQAELLAVRSLQAEGLTAEEIAQRLQWSKSKVLHYLDEDYNLPRASSLGGQPTELAVKIGKPAVRPLIYELKDHDSLVRSNAVKALGAIQDPRAVEPLIKVLNDKDPLIQRQAAQALGRINDPRAVQPLIVVLEDKSRKPHVRMSAAQALGLLGDPRAVESLIVALNDDHWDVRSHAAEALGRIKDPQAVEPLIEALKDEDVTVRGNAVDALAMIRDRRALEALSAALTDKSPLVRQKAARALTLIAGEDFSDR
jgi:HEAT repeat protein